MNKEIFVKKSKEIYKNIFDYSKVEYKGSRTNILIKCRKHGFFQQIPERHLKGHGCLKCNKLKLFIEKSKKIYGNKYDYSLVDYINQYTKVKIICPVHGVFEQTPKKHYKCNCKKCSDDKKRYNKKFFIKKSKEIHKNKYDYSLVNYKDSHNKVKIICPSHGVFEQKPYIHLSGRNGCRICDNERKHLLYKSNSKDFIIKSKKIHGNKYNYSLVNYFNRYTKVKIICTIHGVFKQKPYIHLNGSGCPLCRSSNGELYISNILDKMNIIYKKEKVFENCRNVNPLLFDFYLPEYNICIEYDGIQHFKSISFFGGYDKLIYIKNNDKLKNNYCLYNKIKLYRINYKEDINKKIIELIKEIKNKNT